MIRTYVLYIRPERSKNTKRVLEGRVQNLNYNAMIEEYTRTEDLLRGRVTSMRQDIKRLPFAERDLLKRRLAVMQEELYDVMLVRMELVRRQQEEREGVLC